MKVWVVLVMVGCCDESEILAIYSTEEPAKALMDKRPGHRWVEEWEVKDD